MTVALKMTGPKFHRHSMEYRKKIITGQKLTNYIFVNMTKKQNIDGNILGLEHSFNFPLLLPDLYFNIYYYLTTFCVNLLLTQKKKRKRKKVNCVPPPTSELLYWVLSRQFAFILVICMSVWCIGPCNSGVGRKRTLHGVYPMWRVSKQSCGFICVVSASIINRGVIGPVLVVMKKNFCSSFWELGELRLNCIKSSRNSERVNIYLASVYSVAVEGVGVHPEVDVFIPQ